MALWQKYWPLMAFFLAAMLLFSVSHWTSYKQQSAKSPTPSSNTREHSGEYLEPPGTSKAKFKIDFSKKYDVCTIGAGLSGAIFAERYAKVLGKTALVLDSRHHIGGNCYDFIDQPTKILRSKYGAHLFRTNDERAWRYINLHSHAPKWLRWQHEVRGWVQGRLVPIPVNAYTVNALFNLSIQTKDEMNEWLRKVQIPCPKDGCQTAEQLIKSRVGEQLFKAIFYDYTVKQWNKEPHELKPAAAARIPVYGSFDPRYFTAKYQVLPSQGYTAWFAALLDDPRIDIVLRTNFFDYRKHLEKACGLIVYTGPVDSYFSDSGLDKLEYRSIQFVEKRYFDIGYVQSVSVVNYPSKDVEFTRSVEYKHFLNQEHTQHSIVVSEKSTDKGDPYYPVPSPRNLELYAKYKKLAEQAEASGSVIFVGRLANYKYFSMDEAIVNALQLFYTKAKAENTPSFKQLMCAESSKAESSEVAEICQPHCEVPKWVSLITQPQRTNTWEFGKAAGVCYGLRKEAKFSPSELKGFVWGRSEVGRAKVAILIRGHFGSTDKDSVAKDNLRSLLQFFPNAKVFIHTWSVRAQSLMLKKNTAKLVPIDRKTLADYYTIPQGNFGGMIVDSEAQILSQLKSLYSAEELAGTVCDTVNVPSSAENIAWLQTWWSVLQASSLAVQNSTRFDAVINLRHDTYKEFASVTKDWTVLRDLVKKYLEHSVHTPTDASCWLFHQGRRDMLGSDSAFATGPWSSYQLAAKWVYEYRAMLEAFCQANPFSHQSRLVPISASLLL